MANEIENVDVDVDVDAAYGGPYKVETNKEAIACKFASLKSTSDKIRYLDSEGFSRSAIEKYLYQAGVRTKDGAPIRYQHVRGVLITPIKKK